MEGLIELVAASFARHGIASPVGDSPLHRPVQPRSTETEPVQAIHPAEPTLTTALPDHNYRKSLQGDPAP